METYEEYPVRCKTCNEQIACFSEDYKALIEAGSTIEEALNELGIMVECSRAALMNPTFVSFNMENREVIEGFKSVDAATDDDAQNESMARPVFTPCLPTQSPQGAPVLGPQTITLPGPTTPGLPGMMQPRVTAPGIPGILQPRVQPIGPTVGPQLRLQTTTVQPTLQPLVQPRVQTTTLQTRVTAVATPMLAGLQTIAMVQPTTRVTPTTRPQLTQGIRPAVVQPIIAPEMIAPIIPGIDIPGNIEELGIAIPVKDADPIDVTKFHEPLEVGLSTINPDPTVPLVQVYVGAGKYVRVLNGRTYLAQ